MYRERAPWAESAYNMLSVNFSVGAVREKVSGTFADDKAFKVRSCRTSNTGGTAE